MKRLICLALLLSVLCAPASRAEALTRGDLLCLYGAHALYDSYDRYDRRVICTVPAGSVVVYLGTAGWSLCVVYGSYAGYIEAYDWYKLESWDGMDYELPDGSMLREWGSASSNDSPYAPDPSPSWSGPARAYVPEFPYSSQWACPNQKLATRSGPNTRYTWTEHYPESTAVRLFYQADGNGVRWAYFEMNCNGQKYRLYTGMKRFDGYGDVPYDREDWTWAEIVATHTPKYGPGNDYAAAGHRVSAGTTVKAFYQQNSWLMYETTTAGGTQRAWAPPEAWR